VLIMALLPGCNLTPKLRRSASSTPFAVHMSVNGTRTGSNDSWSMRQQHAGDQIALLVRRP